MAELEVQVRELRLAVEALSARPAGSEQGFEVVHPVATANTLPSSQSSSPSVTRAARPVSASTSAPTPSERSAACREIGLWLRRATDGQHRGPSGRDRIPQSSRYWVITRDVYGNLVSPIAVVSRFADCKPLVKRGNELGEAVFVGLAARGDVIQVCAAGGFTLPSEWLSADDEDGDLSL